ncbi:MAG: outer membrane beta-barrel protein [Alphaproteobacteria bacterium]|nr:outer membrane beta-barrel protein [Alphaproteobacteria bacterium]
MDRKILGATFLGTLALGTAPVSAQPMNDVGSPWRGLYIGIGGHLGEAFGGNKLSFQDLSTAQDLSFQANNSDHTLLGGVQLGQLWPVGGMVLGLESDISFGKDIDFLSSIRGVVGVPLGPALIYGTGGLGQEVAPKNFGVSSATGEIDTFAGKESKYGWTVGGGVEFMVAPRITLGAEAIHYDFGSDTMAMNTVLGAEPFNVIAQRSFTVVRARIDYHFSNFF